MYTHAHASGTGFLVQKTPRKRLLRSLNSAMLIHVDTQLPPKVNVPCFDLFDKFVCFLKYCM